MTRDELEAIRARDQDIRARGRSEPTMLTAQRDRRALLAYVDELLETQRKFGTLMHAQMEKYDALREAAQRFFDEYDGGSVDGVATALADLRRLLEVIR